MELSQQSYSNFSRFTGHKAAQIVVFALPGANAIQVADRVYKAMAEMSQQFPEGMKYAIRYDTTLFVREAITAVYHTLFIAGVLVLVVILLFLQNFRGMLVPATTVPVTIIGAFIAMAGLGFTVNLMTLFALILAIGIVVDDAIIIVENSSYYIEQGMPPKEATIKAMEELTGPVMGITLALVAVFLPAAFLPGITGQIFRQFALVIAATAVISAINALTLKPVQCATWLRPRGDKRPNWFYRGFNRAFEGVTKVYVGVVAWMVKHTVLMIVALRPHRRGDRLGLRPPAHRVPPHRGPGVRRPGVHPARRRRSAPVARGRGQDLRAPREDRRAGGMGDHRRVLGPRLRQRPERLHDLHRVQELERARQGADPGPDRLRPQPRPVRDPGSLGLRGDPAADPRPRARRAASR